MASVLGGSFVGILAKCTPGHFNERNGDFVQSIEWTDDVSQRLDSLFLLNQPIPDLESLQSTVVCMNLEFLGISTVCG
jgi:hypothetical protein